MFKGYSKTRGIKMIEFLLFFYKEIFFSAKDTDIKNKNFDMLKFLAVRILVLSILLNFFLFNRVLHLGYKLSQYHHTTITIDKK
jgi:hypothetical protein